MSAYQPLDCDLHDYLEIACLYHYDLRVELVSGNSFIAQALTTFTAESKEEYLVLESDTGRHEMRLDHLAAITPLNPNARFGRVTFRP